MSGGSMNYAYCRIDECAYYFDDREIKDLIKDLAELVHDLEWYDSGDYSKEDYEETLANFKTKWFGNKRNERLKEYIASTLDDMKLEIEKLI